MNPYKPLEWNKLSYEEDGNTIFEANSIILHDEGTPYKFRVYGVHRDDQIVWIVDDSDGDLIPTEAPISFGDEDEAMAYCEQLNRTMFDVELKLGERIEP